MRAMITRWLLRCWEARTPGWMISLELQILCNLTARAFGQRKKQIWHMKNAEALKAYAAFTKACMEQTGGDPSQLFKQAEKTGRRVRLLTGLKDQKELEKLIFFLYRNLSISMSGRLPGEVTVSDCFFSRYYTQAQCRMMSFADSGIISGILGGGTLVFSHRITEGCGQCRACFQEGTNKK